MADGPVRRSSGDRSRLCRESQVPAGHGAPWLFWFGVVLGGMEDGVGSGVLGGGEVGGAAAGDVALAPLVEEEQ